MNWPDLSCYLVVYAYSHLYLRLCFGFLGTVAVTFTLLLVVVFAATAG